MAIEAGRKVTIPKGELPGGKPSDRQMLEFAKELRKSELRKIRALNAALRAHGKQRKYLSQRARTKPE